MDNNKENVNPRKKNRKPREYLINKLKRESGAEYQTKSGRTVPAKQFIKTICKCRKSCHLAINEAQQKEIFQRYYSLSSWNQKTSFLLNHIVINDIKKRRKPTLRKNIQFKKTFNRTYFFVSKENQVCKIFFKNVLQITEGRIEKCVKKRQKMSSTCAMDLRGRHSNRKRTPAEKLQKVLHFIRLLPTYESHYTRETCANTKKYLNPDLNLKILYEEYKKHCIGDESVVSMYMFRDVFYRRFNLRFKPPAQDTCDYCNKVELKIKAAPIKTVERISLVKEKSHHLEEIEFLRREYREHVDESKLSADEKIVLVFDLQKISETPKLSTNCAYYKRMLSTYNLCIHDCTHNRSYMYVWHEALASKGPAEITSCLIHHVKNFVPKECRNLVLYSDSTGAQNRNIKTSVIGSFV